MRCAIDSPCERLLGSQVGEDSLHLEFPLILVVVSDELADAARLVMVAVLEAHDVLGIVTMLDFHVHEAGQIKVFLCIALSGEARRQVHMHVEALVSFVLAVADALVLWT